MATHTIAILWSESPEPDDNVIRYEFATRRELDAFQLGIEQADGWLGHEIITGAGPTRAIGDDGIRRKVVNDNSTEIPAQPTYTATNSDPEAALADVWEALFHYRDLALPEGENDNDSAWDDITTAMAWITEALNIPQEDDS